jgi:hypothetical protein
MKFFTSLLLILSVFVLAGSAANLPISSSPMTAGQLAAASGAGFWGGFACGVAAGVSIFGVAAIITAAGAGTTVGVGVAFAASAALHVDAICALID